MKENFFGIGKKISSIVIAASMLMGLSANAADMSQNQINAANLHTAVENGSFEDPQWRNNISSWESITDYQTQEYLDGRATSGFYWKTTASDSLMELWNGDKKDPAATSGRNTLNAVAGNQYAELNADEESTLYQNIATIPGAVFRWGLSHSGRTQRNTMALIIGAAQTDDSIKKSDKEGRDPFMKMIDWVQNTREYQSINHNSGCSDPIIVYSKALTSDVKATNNYFTYTEGVSGYDHEWKCWIITDDARSWGHYGLNATRTPDYDYTYEVPENQYASIFAFVSIDGDNNDRTLGNFLDGIEFEKAFPLRVATTGGGTGRVEGKDFNGTTVYEAVTRDDDYIGRFFEHDTPVIYAKAEDGYKFLGAYYDGILYTAEDSFYSSETGEYYHDVIMNGPRYVQLIFTAESTVIHDPNMGLYKGTSEDTITKMDAVDVNLVECEGDAVPLPGYKDKIQFIGWYFARGGQQADGSYVGDLITSEHKVVYDDKENEELTDDMLVVTYKNTRGEDCTVEVPVADGVTFIAEWEALQKAIAMTKPYSETTYTESADGGSVIVRVTDYDGLSDGTGREHGSNDTSAWGWGRLRDNVAMLATAKEGYTFDGWYDAEGKLLSRGRYYTYNVAEPTEVFARFSQNEAPTVTPTPTPTVSEPYVSFITDGTSTTDVAPFNEGSHVKRGNETIASGGTGGVEVYGNTISTGFILEFKGDGASYDTCAWEISVPDADGVYVKAGANAESAYNFTLGTAILTDNATVNTGAIYPATEGSLTVGVFDDLGTTITTEGSVKYGMVIDNIYAPNAVAKGVFEAECPDGYTNIIEVDNTVQAGSAAAYQTDENNIYNLK